MQNNLHIFINGLIAGKRSYRGNCPECGGNNTFAITNNNGKIFYYCFRSSCKLMGVIDHEVSIDELRGISNNMDGILVTTSTKFIYRQQRYLIPEYFTSPLQNSSCYAFLNRYNLIDFYGKHVDRIRYDPKQHRCVFILTSKGECYGAVGRSLNFSVNPRWFVYSRIDGCPYEVFCSNNGIFGRETAALLVEDCVSASVASSVIDSIALLGTTISNEVIKYLLPYDRLYLALDDDATGKAIKLQKQLNIYNSTFIIPLKKDIKYFTKQELEELKRKCQE